MTLRLLRVIAVAALLPWQTAPMALGREHRHVSDHGHEHSVVHRHASAHGDVSDRMHAELAVDGDGIQWLEDGALSQPWRQAFAPLFFEAARTALPQPGVGPVPTQGLRVPPAHGPPRSAHSLRGPPSILA